MLPQGTSFSGACLTRRVILAVFACLFFLPIFTVSTYAQSALARENQILGRVGDANGATLPGASVTLNNLATGVERIAVTEAGAGFAFPAVRNSRYKLIATATGFATAVQVLEPFTGDAVEFSLEPAGLAERIMVVSGSRQEELRESLKTKVDVIGRNANGTPLPIYRTAQSR